jgi:tryptophanyl-tRNA synthetase
MNNSDKNNLNEDMSKSDVAKEVKIYMDSASFKAKIEKIVKDRLKNDKELEDKMVEISSNVLTQLYKTLWIKRSVWKNNLSNKSN